MKRFALLFLSVATLTSCIQQPPPPPPPRQHTYHEHTRTVYVVPVRAAPVTPESAESFRAVERPATYSQ